MSRRTQKDSGEERVTAKSKPMMNLVSRSSERTPDVLACTASESPVKTRHESQIPLSSWNEQQPRTGRPVMLAHQTPQNGILTKNGLLNSGTLMKCWKQERDEQPYGLFTQHTNKLIDDDDDVDSDTVAQSYLSLKTRSFLLRVTERVRKMLDQSSKDATQDCNKHSLIWKCVCLRHWKHLFS